MKSPAEKRLLAAEWVAPMSAPMMRDGAIVISNNRILDLGPSPAMRAGHPDAMAIELGQAIVLPGLINAHTHLELSHMRAGQPPATFTDWVIRLLKANQTIGNDKASLKTSIPLGVEQCRRFGVTAVGDITTRPKHQRHLMGNHLRGISFGEVRAMAQRRHLLDERLAEAAAPIDGPSPCIGISPHAPYSLETEGYARCLDEAHRSDLPLTTHLAETPCEREFLASHTGPFRELWSVLGGWDELVPRFDGGPIRFAQFLGLLDNKKSSLAHVNYCDDDELAILANGRASVVFCPRTHRYFNHPPHRWREMLDRGINVAIGTDSCASSPDLNLVDDLRLVHQIAPDFPADLLWQMVTTRAARALSLERVGALQVGNFADLVIFDVNTADPLTEILESNWLPRQVWIGGHQLPNSGG